MGLEYEKLIGMYENNTQNKSIHALNIIEKISGAIVILCGAYILLSSLFAGPFFFLIAVMLLFSVPGIIGIVALLVWATAKAIRMSKEDRLAFMSFHTNTQQRIVIVLLTIFIVLFAVFMLL